MGSPAAASSEKTVVVVMGATGSGKSRLAVDLAAHFHGVEVVNADSMQVYKGLDVLTNKIPLSDRKGVPHHLLGTVDPNVEFTAKDFRDLAVPVIDGILARGGLPVIVGGTNYYIQALVSPYLVDDFVDNAEGWSLNASRDVINVEMGGSYDCLKEIDPVAANRIHPNDHRKIDHYLSLYTSTGVLPSKLFQEKYAKKWGRADNLRYNCCFIWLDASLAVLDKFVNQRVDCMVSAGLLDEACSIYNLAADYTRGLRQAIGIKDFETFFISYFSDAKTSFSCNQKVSNDSSESVIKDVSEKTDFIFRTSCLGIVDNPENILKPTLDKAIDNMKANTRRLVRCQRRRLNRLTAFYGWDLHHIDATEAFLCNSEESWQAKVIEPCLKIIKDFLCKSEGNLTASIAKSDLKLPPSRDLWTQYTCEACGHRILRGLYEWEQHVQGRGHRKRIFSLRKKHMVGHQGQAIAGGSGSPLVRPGSHSLSPDGSFKETMNDLQH